MLFHCLLASIASHKKGGSNLNFCFLLLGSLFSGCFQDFLIFALIMMCVHMVFFVLYLDFLEPLKSINFCLSATVASDFSGTVLIDTTLLFQEDYN